jgi:hypothetical protein
VSNAFIDKLKGYSALSVDDVRLLEAACSSNREEGFANAIERIIFGGGETCCRPFLQRCPLRRTGLCAGGTLAIAFSRALGTMQRRN